MTDTIQPLHGAELPEEGKSSRTQECPGEARMARPEGEGPITSKSQTARRGTDLPTEAIRANRKERKTKSLAVSQLVSTQQKVCFEMRSKETILRVQL